jgi:hypothetical protein
LFKFFESLKDFLIKINSWIEFWSDSPVSVQTNSIIDTIFILSDDGTATVANVCRKFMIDNVRLNRMELSSQGNSFSVNLSNICFIEELFTGISNDLKLFSRIIIFDWAQLYKGRRIHFLPLIELEQYNLFFKRRVGEALGRFYAFYVCPITAFVYLRIIDFSIQPRDKEYLLSDGIKPLWENIVHAGHNIFIIHGESRSIVDGHQFLIFVSPIHSNQSNCRIDGKG